MILELNSEEFRKALVSYIEDRYVDTVVDVHAEFGNVDEADYRNKLNTKTNRIEDLPLPELSFIGKRLRGTLKSEEIKTVVDRFVSVLNLKVEGELSFICEPYFRVSPYSVGKIEGKALLDFEVIHSIS